ncbi:MAG: LLM class flavin-dependent oxidoreductase [Acidimicrobiales bacterium]
MTEANHPMPALSLAAVPGRRARTVALATEIDQRGFSGIFCPSMGDAMGLCLAAAMATERVTIGTSIQPIYLQHAATLAASACFINEMAEGRFRLGLGVTHGPIQDRLGVTVGRPLADMRAYVDELRASAKHQGELPTITLATLRDKMVALSVEIADGAVWANASRSRMAHSLAQIPSDRTSAGFFVGNMIPTVIDDDLAAAAARNRATLKGYVSLPNYRNYWADAGYAEEMAAVEKALADGDEDALFKAMTDRWLSDCTLYGPVGRIRDGVDAWFEAGVSTPILVPAATSGGQMRAFEQIFAAWD